MMMMIYYLLFCWFIIDNEDYAITTMTLTQNPAYLKPTLYNYNLT